MKAINNIVKHLKDLLFVFIVINIVHISAFTSERNSSNNFKAINLTVSIDTLVYQLPDNSIVVNSEVVLNNNIKLKKNIDYQIDYQLGFIVFANNDLLSEELYVQYYVIPNFFREKLFAYKMQNIPDSLVSLPNTKRSNVMSSEDSKLVVNGSKSFSISFSNQQSYDLKQSLYLTLSGELSNNMKLEGRLSDNQSPLTPEGDSREISNIDQINLKLYGKQYDAMFGSQEYGFTGTELMDYNTKFEGINLSYYDKFKIQAAVAVNGGKSQTNIIQGIDGKQGPYYLSANGTTQTIQVVSGSEVVSINGRSYNRGIDYIIDYSEGSLTFKTLITSNSRIVVDFQYSDEYYSQNLFLTSSSVNLTPSLLIEHHFIKQTDNKNNPLLWSFTESDEDSLSNAGDNIVWGQGVIESLPGSGRYLKKTDDNNNEYYQYAINDSTAIYNLFFSYVGYGNGDYEPIGTNIYKYIGKLQGSWLPQKKLIAPVDKLNLGLNLKFNNNWFDFKLEGMYSNLDKNTLSGKNDSDNLGYLTHSKIDMYLDDFKLNPKLSLTYENRSNNVFTFSNLNPANESYEYSIIPQTDSIAQSQFDLSLRLNNQNDWNQLISARYKLVRKVYWQQAIKSETLIHQYKLFPSFYWNGLYSKQTYSDTINADSEIHNHTLENSWKWIFLTLKNIYLLQKNNYSILKSNTLALEGTKYNKINPQIIFSNNNTLNSEFSYSNEINSHKRNRTWKDLKISDTWQYKQLINKQTNTLALNLTHREVFNNGDYVSAQNKKQVFDLLDLKSSHQLLDNTLSLLTFYQLNQLEFYPKVRELQFVGSGYGLYDSTGVQMVNGDYDYTYINSGTSKMSTEINANLNIFFHLSKKFYPNSIFHRFNFDSSFQITESTEQKSDIKLYLLFPEEVFQQGTTIYGRQYMQHTLWLDIWRKVVTGTIKYETGKTIDARYQEYNSTTDDNVFFRTTNHSIEYELDWKQVLGNQLRTSYQNDYHKDTRYNTAINNDIVTAVIFRNFSPVLNTQFSLSYSQEKGNSSNSLNEYRISYLTFNPSLTWFFKNKYRISSIFLAQFNNRKGSSAISYLPEKRNGSVYTWSLQSQYRLNSFTSGSLEYSAKSYPNETILHELKMEFRAEL